MELKTTICLVALSLSMSEALLADIVADIVPDPPMQFVPDDVTFEPILFAPVYPAEALEYCIEGFVIVSLTVDTDGTVVDVKILESEPEAVFDEAAVKSVSKFRYKPGQEIAHKNHKVSFEIEDFDDCLSELPRDRRSSARDIRAAAEKNFVCSDLAKAHAALLNGCFSARREFVATLNKKPVRRNIVQLDYAAGRLDIELIEEEIFDKRIQMDGDGDMVAESTFSCDRMIRKPAGRYELESAEDSERIIFYYDRDNSVLLPYRWEFEEKARFLFKKFHIRALADYSNVSYKPCDSTTGTTD